MRMERQGSHTVGVSRRLPQVRGGVCEYCGIIDPAVDSQYQYKLCPHFRGMQGEGLRCTYCPAEKNPDEVVRNSAMNIAEHPDKPGVLVAWCGSYDCSAKHLERFKVSA